MDRARLHRNPPARPLGGLVVTLGLIAATAPFGVLIGAAVAVGRVYGARPVQCIARAYVAFFKGCPLLLLLFILYFGLPSVGISLSPFVAAVLGFIFCNSAADSGVSAARSSRSRRVSSRPASPSA